MKNLWNDAEAAQFKGDLGLRVYTSRLLGRDKSLVLHGGGNTSVKIGERNLVGEEEEILYVKGSGWDLEFIEEAGFSPVRMQHLLKLARLETLSDPADGERARHAHDARIGARAVGRDDPARDPSAQVRRPHARRRRAVGHQYRRWRSAHARDLRRPGRGHPVRHAGLRSGAVLRAAVSRRSRSRHHRHGADEPRHLFVRRHGAANRTSA